MKAFSTRFICSLVILSSIILPYSAHTQAALIGTEQAIANVQAQRDKVNGFVARADVQKQFAALGMDPAVAGERVNALTDDEVQQVAGKIDSLPVGADGGAGLVVTVLLIVVLVILIMYLLDNKRWR
jgi:hypothetical protein